MLYRITLGAALLFSTLLFTTSAIAGVTTNKRTIYFEQGTIGTPQKEYVILDNEGDELVLIEEVQIVGPDADNFTTTYTGGLPRFIYSGQTPWLPVTFTPSSNEAQNATLQLVVNNGQLINIGLNGNVEGSIVANKTTLDFGTLEKGESKTLSTILSNISKDLKIITSVEITGEGAENFSTNYTEKLPRFIYPGQEPWVSVTSNCVESITLNARLELIDENEESSSIDLIAQCGSSTSFEWIRFPETISARVGASTPFVIQFKSPIPPNRLELIADANSKDLFRLGNSNYDPITQLHSVSINLDPMGDESERVQTAIFNVLADGLIHGSENSLEVVVDALDENSIPVTLQPPSEDRIIQIDESMFIRDELIISYRHDDPEAEDKIRRLASEFEAKIIGSVPEVNIYQLRFPETSIDDLMDIEQEVNARDDILYGIKNFTGSQAFRLPDDGVDQWDVNWPFLQSKADLFDVSGKSSSAWKQPVETAIPELENLHHRIINTPEAWDIQTGNPNTKILIIDGGFDEAHPDLAASVREYDPVNSSLVVKADSNIRHGTAVSGTACATGNNSIGRTGVSWQCSLYLAEVPLAGDGIKPIGADFEPLSANFPGRIISIKLALFEAVTFLNAARRYRPEIVNMSLGGPGSSAPYREFIDILSDVHELKPLLVIAAGNNFDTDGDPSTPRVPINASQVSPANLSDFSEYEKRVITVANTIGYGLLNDTSSFGAVIDVAAPGLVNTTNYRKLSDYLWIDGTSFSAPIVTGLAALIVSEHPGIDSEKVRRCIVEAANTYGRPVRTSEKSGGNSSTYNVIDAPSAVLCATELEPAGLNLIPSTRELKFDSTAIGNIQDKAISFNVSLTEFRNLVEHIAIVGYEYYNFEKFPNPSFDVAGKATIPFRYTPKTPGTHQAYLLFILKDGTKLEIPITGSSAISLTATPEELDFGSVQVGNSRTETITLTNMGSDLVDLSEVGFSTGDLNDFTAPDFASLSRFIGPGGTDTITIEFTPTQEGPRNTIFNIRANGDLLEAPIKGTGVLDPLSLKPANSEIDFGILNIGEESSIGMEITNESSERVTLSTIEFDGEFAENFGTNFSPTLVFTPDGKKVIFFSFTPQIVGELSATATLITEDGNRVEISLVGVGETERELSGTINGTIAGGGIVNPSGNQISKPIPTTLKPNEMLIVDYTFTGQRRLGSTIEYSVRAPSAEFSKRIRIIPQDTITERIVVNGFISEAFNPNTLWFNGKIGRVLYSAEWQIVDRNNPNEFGTWNSAGNTAETAVNVCDTSRLLGNSGGGVDDHYYKMRVDAGESVFISGETRGTNNNGILLDYYLVDAETGAILADEEFGIVRPEPSGRNISWTNNTGEDEEILFVFSPRGVEVIYDFTVSLPNSGCDIGIGASALLLSEEEVDFGTVDVGTEASSTIQLTNVIPGDVDVVDVQIEGGDGQFSTTTELPITFMLNETKDLTFTFNPTSAGTANATATLSFGTVRPNITIPLTGEANSCSLSFFGTGSTDLIPSVVDFGDVEQFGFEDFDFGIENREDFTVSFNTDFINPSNQFSSSLRTGTNSIGPAGNTPISNTVIFEPTELGLAEATFRLTAGECIQEIGFRANVIAPN